MPPPPAAVFRTQGSQDSGEVKTTGFEMFSTLKYFRHKFILFLTFLFSAFNGAVPIFQMMYMGDMTTAFSTDFDKTVPEKLTPFILKMLWWNIAQVFVLLFSMVFRSYATPTFNIDLRNAIFTSLMNQPIDYFDKTSSGVLVSRLSEDVTLVRETYIDKTCMVLQGLAQAVIGIIMAFVKNQLVSLIILIAAPIVLIVYWLGTTFVDHLWSEFNEHSTTAASKAEEVITQFRTVKAFDGEMKEFEEYSKSLDGINHVYKKTAIAHGTKDAIINLIANMLTVVILYLVTYLIIKRPQRNVAAGDAMSLMMYLMMGTMGLTQSFSAVEDYRNANIASAKILEIINLKPDIDRHQGNVLSEVKGKVEFRDVGFKYSTRDAWAVRHLSFVIEPGETVALVGESGCGKTTTLSLLQRFYEITEGQILLDDVDITSLSPVFLRSQISIVPQSPVLFTMSIADNIRYGRPQSTDEEIAKAAEVGNAHNFIMTIKNNYKEEVQQTSLSGGQKQRICISRAILADAPILLLDEATAALDTESEQLVQQSLERVRKGKTAIVVAHRLATVKNADRILVFQNGTIAESGKHDELVQKGGIYADLVKFQLQ